MYVMISKMIKSVTGTKKHYGYHPVMNGHLADSCSSGSQSQK